MVDFSSLWVSFAEFAYKRPKKGSPPSTQPGDGKRKLSTGHDLTPILLLVGNSETRDYLSTLLSEHFYRPILVRDHKELLQSVHRRQSGIILIDCGSVTEYGPRIISKIKVACQSCRIIMFCDKSHLCDKVHRELIKNILDIGIYACILTPYQDWEILSMVSCYPSR